MLSYRWCKGSYGIGDGDVVDEENLASWPIARFTDRLPSAHCIHAASRTSFSRQNFEGFVIYVRSIPVPEVLLIRYRRPSKFRFSDQIDSRASSR